MPSFQSPLSYTSRLDVHPSPAEPAYVHLTFLATFDENEDTSGTWEIWTDLPLLDEKGKVTSDEGSWRSIAFQPVEIGKAPVVNGSTSDEVPHSSSSTLALEATSLPETLRESVTRMSLSLSIPASAGQTYAYTYRRVLPSGETHWLGGEGSNGVISVVEGTMHGTQIGESSWQGERPADESVTFTGVGIEVLEENG